MSGRTIVPGIISFGFL